MIPLLTRRPLRPKNANFQPALPNDITTLSLPIPFCFVAMPIVHNKCSTKCRLRYTTLNGQGSLDYLIYSRNYLIIHGCVHQFMEPFCLCDTLEIGNDVLHGALFKSRSYILRKFFRKLQCVESG